MPGRREIPCKCELDNPDKDGEPDTIALTGKSCDQGHRWISPKTIFDSVEALIGAHFFGGGTVAALVKTEQRTEENRAHLVKTE